MIMKADPDLKKIPVIILTGSREKTDIMNAYSLAECYLTKPITAQQILEFVMSLNLFQLMIVAPETPKAV
jgi:CheY-like chemotaxis protein